MIRNNARLWYCITLLIALHNTPLFTQDAVSPVQERSWSIAGSGHMNFPVSASMRGTNEEFRNDVSVDYNNMKYPFANYAYAIGWSGKLMYALPSSAHTDLFIGFNGNFIGNSSETSFDKAFMAVWGVNIGAEYSLLPRWNTFNVFGRASICASFIHGFSDYDYGFGIFRTKVPTAGRLGVEGEIGGRFIIPSSAIALELSSAYLNANLLGKSYTKPPVAPDKALYERELNDGANPDNSNDNSRTIDFLSLRFGARIWF